MAKYGQVAEQNDLRVIPAVFSHTGQIHEAFKTFVREQFRAKLEHFEGPVKSSKVRSHLKWWVKCISAVIAILIFALDKIALSLDDERWRPSRLKWEVWRYETWE